RIAKPAVHRVRTVVDRRLQGGQAARRADEVRLAQGGHPLASSSTIGKGQASPGGWRTWPNWCSPANRKLDLDETCAIGPVATIRRAVGCGPGRQAHRLLRFRG